MDEYITISYVLSLILLLICIICLRIANSKPDLSKLMQWVLRLAGITPGFIGVLAGVYIQIQLKDPAGFAIMSAWLILEIGSVQLLNILKNLDSSKKAS